MVKEIYSIGGFYFYSAKEVADFKTQESEYWEQVKHLPLKKRGIQVDTYQDFVDYLDSLEKEPDICLAYSFDNARWYGYYTTVWVNGLEVRGIFGYLESNNIKDHLVFEMVAMSKWHGMEIRQNNCQ